MLKHQHQQFNNTGLVLWIPLGQHRIELERERARMYDYSKHIHTFDQNFMHEIDVAKSILQIVKSGAGELGFNFRSLSASVGNRQLDPDFMDITYDGLNVISYEYNWNDLYIGIGGNAIVQRWNTIRSKECFEAFGLPRKTVLNIVNTRSQLIARHIASMLSLHNFPCTFNSHVGDIIAPNGGYFEELRNIQVALNGIDRTLSLSPSQAMATLGESDRIELIRDTQNLRSLAQSFCVLVYDQNEDRVFLVDPITSYIHSGGHAVIDYHSELIAAVKSHISDAIEERFVAVNRGMLPKEIMEEIQLRCDFLIADAADYLAATQKSTLTIKDEDLWGGAHVVCTKIPEPSLSFRR